MKIGQRCLVHKGLYAGIARSFSGEPDNHIWLLDAKSPEEYMNWVDATAWAESLGGGYRPPYKARGSPIGLPPNRRAGGEMVMCGLALLRKGSEHGVSIGAALGAVISVVLTRPILTAQEQ